MSGPYPVRRSQLSTESLDLLPGQLQDSPVFKAFTRAFLDQVTDVNEALWDCLTKRWMSNATGAPLDSVGEIVNLTRNGLSDEDYRAQLYIEVAIHASKGTAEDILRLARDIANPEEILYFRSPPLALAVYLHIPQYVAGLSLLQRAAGAGTKVFVSASLTDNPFVLSDNGTMVNGFGSGVGELTEPLIGGQLAEIYTVGA